MKGESESLQIEQEANLSNFWTTDLQAFVEKGIGECIQQCDRTESEQASLKQESIAAEKEFAKRVIFACTRWHKEEDRAVVLWDIDETIGISTVIGDKRKWFFRPVIVPLMQFIRTNFSSLSLGILSDRTRVDDQLRGSLPGEGADLRELQPFIDTQHLYTSRGISVDDLADDDELRSQFSACPAGFITGSIQKLKVIRELRRSGINVKLIDDFGVAGYLEKDGVQVYDCMPFRGQI